MLWFLFVLTALLDPAGAAPLIPAPPSESAPTVALAPPFEAFGFVLGEARQQVRARDPHLQTLPGGNMTINRRIAGEATLLVLTFLDDRLVKVSAGFNLDGAHDTEWTLLLARRLEIALREKLGGPPVQKHEPAMAYRLLVDDYYLAVWPQGGVKASVQVTLSRGLPLVLVVYEAVAAADRIQQQLQRDLVDDL